MKEQQSRSLLELKSDSPMIFRYDIHSSENNGHYPSHGTRGGRVVKLHLQSLSDPNSFDARAQVPRLLVAPRDQSRSLVRLNFVTRPRAVAGSLPWCSRMKQNAL